MRKRQCLKFTKIYSFTIYDMKESPLTQFLNVQHTDLCQCNCKVNYVADKADC